MPYLMNGFHLPHSSTIILVFPGGLLNTKRYSQQNTGHLDVPFGQGDYSQKRGGDARGTDIGIDSIIPVQDG